MNLWKVMNLAAWGLSIYLLAVMFTDFFKVEMEKRNSREKTAGIYLPGPVCEYRKNAGVKESSGQIE